MNWYISWYNNIKKENKDLNSINKTISKYFQTKRKKTEDTVCVKEIIIKSNYYLIIIIIIVIKIITILAISRMR